MPSRTSCVVFLFLFLWRFYSGGSTVGYADNDAVPCYRPTRPSGELVTPDNSRSQVVHPRLDSRLVFCKDKTYNKPLLLLISLCTFQSLLSRILWASS